jgi:hypothetical protein
MDTSHHPGPTKTSFKPDIKKKLVVVGDGARDAPFAMRTKFNIDLKL